MWLSFLPFSLWDACHWVTIPASGVIAFLLLGIEEIGVQIEEPFGILPLGGSHIQSYCLIILPPFLHDLWDVACTLWNINSFMCSFMCQGPRTAP